MRKEKQYEATIKFRDKNIGHKYEFIRFYARTKKEAKKIAGIKASSMAFLYCSDNFTVEDIHKVK